MRPSILVLTLSLALGACSRETSPDPVAPAATIIATSAHTVTEARSLKIQGTLEAFETDTYQPETNTLAVHLEGTGTASHLGRYTMVDDGIGFLSTGVGLGRITFTAANGDVLTGAASGHAVIDNGVAEVTDTTAITGGTGRFAAATGTIVAVRTVNMVTGLSSGSFDGTITLR